MQKRTLILAVALATLALPAYGAPTQTVAKDYTVGLGDLGAQCTETENRGGACFDVPSGTVAATLLVDDDFAPRTVAALVSHYVGDRLYTSWHLCESWQWLGVPPGVTMIRIDLQSLGGMSDCGIAAPATTGTITITWHDAE